jgi:hypothetical protein
VGCLVEEAEGALGSRLVLEVYEYPAGSTVASCTT